MAPVLLSFGSFNIYGYGLFMALGAIAAVLGAMRRVRKYHLDEDMYFNGIFIGIICGIICSKVLFWIVELDYYLEDPSRFLNLNDGFVFYGGAIGGIVAPYIYVHFIKKQTFVDKLDVGIPYMAIGQMLGRIGCLLAGCCYGKEAPEGAWYAITFPAGSEAPANVGLYPTQIISAIALLALFFILILVARKQKFAGQIISTYMIVYSVGRFLIEFLRNDPRGSVGPFSTSQFISMFILACGIGMYVVFSGKKIPVPSTKAPETPAEEVAETPTEEVAETPAEEVTETPAEETQENTEA